MNKYEIYYELNGRKMKTIIHAATVQIAEQIIRNRLIIHKVKPILANPFEEIFQKFNNIPYANYPNL